MKRSLHSRPILWTAAALALPGALLADTIIMKDGKKYENAKVLEESPLSVRFDYIVVGKIHDQRTEQKANVAQILKERPEEMEWKDLKSKLTLPMPDLSTADKYESVIQDSLRPFVTKFPGTPEAKEVEGLIKELQDEKEKVTSGSIKVDGQWISAELAKRDARNIEAFRAWAEIKDLLAKANLPDALNLWEKFATGSENFVDTMHFVKAVPEVLKAMTNYETALRQMVVDQPILQRRRDDMMKGLVEPDLTRVKNAIDKEINTFKQAYSEASQMRKTWTPVYKYDLKVLQDQLKELLTEKAKLAALDLKDLTAQNEALQAARHYIADKNVEKAEESLAKISKNGNREISNQVSVVRTEVTKLKSELSKNKARERIYGKVGTPTFGGEPAAGGAMDRIKAAEAAAAEGKSAASAELDAKGKEALSKEEASKPKAAAVKEDEPKKTGTTQRARTYNTDSSALEEEGSLFQSILLYGGLPLLAVLGFLMWQQKKKNA